MHLTGQQNLTFSGDAAALGTCATTVEGTVESGALTMNINVKEDYYHLYHYHHHCYKL